MSGLKSIDNMNVLLFNNVPHQIHLLKGVSNNLLSFGTKIDVYNMINGVFYSPVGRKVPFYLKILKIFSEDYVVTRKVKKGLFCYLFIDKFIAPYNIVDFQGLFASEYVKLIPIVKKIGKKVKITLWGSDFYRLNDVYKKRFMICFDSADIIQVATEQMKYDFLQTYPQYKEKIRVARFGLSQLDTLKELLDKDVTINDSFLGIPNDCIVVTCGYNAMPAQRHKIIVEAIKTLPEKYKDSLYLLFPMTYGGNPEYIQSVDMSLKESGLRYRIFTERLSLEQLMILRKRSELVVNIQETDALAASLQEHMMAGGLLVAGDWLPYSIYDQSGIYFRKTSLEDLSSNILWAIDHYQEKKLLLMNNRSKIYNLSSWKAVSPEWDSVYKELQ